MPGISLSDLDDEITLLKMLASYAREQRRQLEVYFDQGSLTAPSEPIFSRVKFHFVRPPRTADDAIRAHLKRLQRQGRNWTVVTSDRALHQAAKGVGARIMTSESFASLLTRNTTSDAINDESEKPEVALDPKEIEDWERLFQDPNSGDQAS
jgi:predicted RNA-binding protein with PIN domain